MHRLATQIHATIVVVLAIFAVLVGVAWWHGPGVREGEQLARGLAVTAAELLPGPTRPMQELQLALGRLSGRFNLSLTVYSPEGTRLAYVGAPLPWPGSIPAPRQSVKLQGPAFGGVLRLPDGRVVVARRPHPDWRHLGGALATVGLLALAVAVGAWPLVRRLTRRLEQLRQRVEDLGRGDLGARAPIEGRDEVAALARSFNRAADRIQELVEAQRRQLAFASHELRSPLARLRVSLEVLEGAGELKQQAAHDIAELDGLIGELLEASRLTAGRGRDHDEAVDLLALAAEEAARVGAEAEGDTIVIRGDARLLRRLVRNLLENAVRHGGGSPVEVRVERGAAGATLRVSDRGPGVAEAERERVFEPFHRPAGAAETGSGYGLGLALVRQIARAHGGTARCLGREGGGTVFEVELAGAGPTDASVE